MQHALTIRDRPATGAMSAHGVDVARGHLFNQLCIVRGQPGTIPDVQRFARHLMVELPAIFSFLVDPDFDATNWRAEHALRPAFVTRKVCGGGNRLQQVLASILRTAHQRRLDTTDVLTALLCAPTPIVSRHLYPTSASVN